MQNVTDVDDPLLERATARPARTGPSWPRQETDLFRDDMAALRMLPPDVYVGAVEAIPPIVGGRASACATVAQAYDVDGDVYFSVDSRRRGSARCRGLDRARDARAVRRARRRPRPAGQEGPARLPALAGRAAGRAGLGQPVRAGTARLAHRVHGDRARRTSAMAIDVQGGGSDLVFPHHEMGASEAQVLTGRVAVRPRVRARRHGRPRRREDVEVQGQPRLRVAAARGRHGPDGDPARAARATTTAATGSGPPRTCRCDRAAGPLARGRDRAESGPPAQQLLQDVRDGACPTTSTRRRALAGRRPVGRGAAPARRVGPRRHRRWSATPSTPCSASPSPADPRRPCLSRCVDLTAVHESKPPVQELPRHVEHLGVVAQDEARVGGEDDAVELERECVGILLGGQLVLFDRCDDESADESR